jgi:hypothetical protein
MFNSKFKLTRQQSKMSQIHPSNKIAIIAQGGDDGDGHSGLSQQPTVKLTTPIDTMSITKISLASFISVDRCLLFHFSNLIEMAPQWPW